ncbi:S1/P1 nuclease [Flavihumibacter sp. R14]|nr:S1/P1 nuclease [Flavihumibacter soli]
MRSLFKLVLLGIFMLSIPGKSMAWGMLGHRIVGQIADSYISGKTRKEVKKILGNESLAMASNWADFIKSDSTFNYLGNWHYANFLDNLDYQTLKQEMEKETGTNIYNRIRFVAAELKNKNTDPAKKKMYLRLLIHFVGDLHQPMHMGRKADAGGNGIKLSWFSQPTNLHRVWDEQLIEYQQLSYTEYADAINFTDKQQVKKLQSDDLTVWAYESYKISRQLYATVKPEDKLSYRYNFDHIATLNQQLLQGGVRLAGLLNEVFISY